MHYIYYYYSLIYYCHSLCIYYIFSCVLTSIYFELKKNGDSLKTILFEQTRLEQRWTKQWRRWWSSMGSESDADSEANAHLAEAGRGLVRFQTL